MSIKNRLYGFIRLSLQTKTAQMITIRRWNGGPFNDNGSEKIGGENFMKLNLVANCIDNCFSQFSDQFFHSDSDQSLNVH